LLITPDLIRLIDFKTARRPATDAGQVSVAILRQMAAYVAALEVAYPGRRVEAALLYTTGPHLIALSSDLLAPHKASLRPKQESLTP